MVLVYQEEAVRRLKLSHYTFKISTALNTSLGMPCYVTPSIQHELLQTVLKLELARKPDS